MKLENRKFGANVTFKLIVFFLACMAGIGILQLFTVLSRTINS